MKKSRKGLAENSGEQRYREDSSSLLSALPDIRSAIEPAVDYLGFEIYDIGFAFTPRCPVLRIYIDNPRGFVSIDDCVRVSRRVSQILDAGDLIKTKYTLEVSSPGAEREIRSESDYQRFRGCDVSVYLRDGGRYLGKLMEKQGEKIFISISNNQIKSFDINNIYKIKLRV